MGYNQEYWVYRISNIRNIGNIRPTLYDIMYIGYLKIDMIYMIYFGIGSYLKPCCRYFLILIHALKSAIFCLEIDLLGLMHAIPFSLQFQGSNEVHGILWMEMRKSIEGPFQAIQGASTKQNWEFLHSQMITPYIHGLFSEKNKSFYRVGVPFGSCAWSFHIKENYLREWISLKKQQKLCTNNSEIESKNVDIQVWRSFKLCKRD